MTNPAPSIIVIARPNGAGKSTVAPALLRDTLLVNEYVNADVIAQGLSAFAPERAALRAGRVMLGRLHELAEARRTFAFETTLASRSFAPWLARQKRSGYLVNLVFLYLSSPELACARVAARVRLGGHNIPEKTIERRYAAGLRSFSTLYEPLADNWSFYDSSADIPELIAIRSEANVVRVRQPQLWEGLKEVYCG